MRTLPILNDPPTAASARTTACAWPSGYATTSCTTRGLARTRPERSPIMFFRQLPTREATLSYFFGCATVGKAVAVDVVAGDEQRFIDEAKKARVAIAYVIDTHVHA